MIKVWVLADYSFFYHWFWYTKGDGPKGISQIPKTLKRNKIVIVILALLNTLLQNSLYGVTLDNFFIFTKLLT